MTAIKDFSTASGIEVKGAIHRVESVTIGYKNKMTYKVRVYTNLSLPCVDEFDCDCDYSGGDAIEEAYSHMNSDGSYTKG